MRDANAEAEHDTTAVAGVVIDAVGGRDAVSGIAASDLVLHDAVAGGADGRADRRRDDQGLSRSDLGPVGDAVDLLDKRREDVEVHAQAVAHAGDILARGHGVGHQIVGKAVRRREVGRRGDRRAGRGRAGVVCGRRTGGNRSRSGAAVDIGQARAVRDQDRVIIARRQNQRPADSQFVPLAVINVVEDHDRVFAGVVVQTELLADPQNIVAGTHRILDGVGACCRGCVRVEGQSRKQGHDHQYGKQHTYDPFLHNCSP